MYSFFWRKLPGNNIFKSIISIIVISIVVFILFYFIFPKFEVRLLELYGFSAL